MFKIWNQIEYKIDVSIRVIDKYNLSIYNILVSDGSRILET
jgi:hypothetical protein